MRLDSESLAMIANAQVVVKTPEHIIDVIDLTEDGAFAVEVDSDIGPISVETDLWGAAPVSVVVANEDMDVTIFWPGAALS